MNHLDELLFRWQEGDLDDQELQQLKERLGSSGERKLLVEYFRMEAGLARAFRADESVPLAHTGTGAPRADAHSAVSPKSFSQQYLRKEARIHRGWRFVAALAAALAVVAGGYWFMNHARASGQYIASVQALGGQVGITRGTQLLQAEVGMLIMDQDTITVVPGASAEIRYAREDTAVILQSGTTAKFSENSDAMQIWLNAGKLACEVAHQPAGRPMRFITPQAVAEVLGTKLSLAVSNAATRLDVSEGSVKLTRNDGASVVVKEGDFAVAAAGVELKAQPVNRPPVIVKPGQSIQAAVNANPTGTAFIIKAGLYREQSVQPKDWDSFIGEPGTIMNGARLLTNFVRQGNAWMATTPVQEGQIHGIGAVDAGWEGSVYPSDLFFDDVALHHVLAQKEVAAGKWYIDYGKGNIHFADDPAGRKVEISVTRCAFSGPASNVTVQGFVVEKYAIPYQFGAIGEQYQGANWLVRSNEVRLNHGSGITGANGARIIGNNVHHNGHDGIGNAALGPNIPVVGLLVEGNELAFNNTLHFNPDWIGGGAKFGSVSGLICSSNNVHDNYGFGLSSDIDCTNITYDGNLVVSNYSRGLSIEKSYTGTIRNNRVIGNGAIQPGWLGNGQILLFNSRDVDISRNVVETAANGGNGIGIIQSDEKSGIYGPRLSINNFCHDNDITMPGTNGFTGAMAGYDRDTMLNGNNRFDANRYHVMNKDARHWYWQDPKTWQEFRAAGQEARGTVDEKMPVAVVRNNL